MLIDDKDCDDLMPLSALRGLKVYTVGSKFLGLSKCAFRRMLREAGANVQRYPTSATRVIVLGDDWATWEVAHVLAKYDENKCPAVASGKSLIDRFAGDLLGLEVSRGTTLEQYLSSSRGILGGASEIQPSPSQDSRS